MKCSNSTIVAGLVVLALCTACTKTSLPSDGDGNQQSDWAAIESLEGEAKSIASIAGCSASSDCRTAPVGSRGCGGPRYYITYCAKSTDSAALQRKLDQVANAERSYNAKYQVISTCEFRMPPGVVVAGGSCTAQ